MIQKRNFFTSKAAPLVLIALLLVGWFLALFIISPDRNQGEVYRIIYLHVPLAFAAFFSVLLLLIYSVRTLLQKDISKRSLTLIGQKSAVEVGLAFTLLTLATGSIWAKPTWNVWWTWDARLTTTLLLAILLFCYLALYNTLNHSSQRMLPCSLLGIVIAIDVPVIYQSVNWWRTLHQPQTILRRGGSSIDPQMLYLLLFNLFVMVAIACYIILYRKHNLKLLDEIERTA